MIKYSISKISHLSLLSFLSYGNLRRSTMMNKITLEPVVKLLAFLAEQCQFADWSYHPWGVFLWGLVCECDSPDASFNDGSSLGNSQSTKAAHNPKLQPPPGFRV